MRKTLIGLAAILALSGTAVAGDFADRAQYLNSPRVDSAAQNLDHSATATIKTRDADKQQRPQTPAPISSRHIYGDSADGVMLPVGNHR